jgi:multidrug efflux pump
MRFSSYFIDRPVFAAVLSAFITIAGAIALFKLPVSEYPEVVPPSVVVNAAYPGANPKVISETVAAPLEQEIVGVEDMLYMSSQATMDGTLALTVTFRDRCLHPQEHTRVPDGGPPHLPRWPLRPALPAQLRHAQRA